jgi:hypothetical protein
MPVNLTKGDIVTIIGISSFMACTARTEMYFTGDYHTIDDVSKPIFKESKAKRKRFTLRSPLQNHGTDKLVFLNLPRTRLVLDSDVAERQGVMTVTSYSGNACFNFMNTPDDIKSILEENLNEDFNEHNSILSLALGKDKPVLVYPHKHAPGTHATIDRILTKKP